jgi:F-type H+-transporting ATPase subunit b
MQIFQISPGLFIWSALTFVILVLLLYKFAFGPLQQMQQKRQAEIRDAIAASERLREEAHALLDDYKQQLSNARLEAEEILERARKVGESARADMIMEAKEHSERVLEKAHEQIERDTQQALAQIRSQVADLTIAATEKVTRKSLSKDDDMRLIREALAEIDLSKVNEN